MITFIEDQDVIRKILTHLGLWLIKTRPRPIAHAPPDFTFEPFNDWPACLRPTHRQALSAEDYLTDPRYPDEA